MHPDVCRFISDAFYEGGSSSAPGASASGTALGTGLRFVAVEHDGNRGDRPRRRTRSAPRSRGCSGRDGPTRRCERGHSRPRPLVVAPYNAQVRAAAGAAPDGRARRHGRQVPGPGGGGRDLLDGRLERRGRAARPRVPVLPQPPQRRDLAGACLAYVVASPRLLEVGCRSIEQMRMANALCRFVEEAA